MSSVAMTPEQVEALKQANREIDAIYSQPNELARPTLAQCDALVASVDAMDAKARRRGAYAWCQRHGDVTYSSFTDKSDRCAGCGAVV
jgi:hypothetical protein